MKSPNLPLDHIEVHAYRAKIEAIARIAAHRADKAVREEKRRVPALYWPSRMTTKSLDKLRALWVAVYKRAMADDMAELDRVDAILARMCPHWPRHSAEELVEPPPPLGRGIALIAVSTPEIIQ